MTETYLDDLVLIDRFRSGDHSAIERLFGKHRPQAYRYALKLTRSHEEAGDIVSEAFIRVHKSLSRFEGKCAFSTWLYRILTNCYFDMRKKMRNKPAISLDAAISIPGSEVHRQLEDAGPSPFELAARDSQEIALNEVVDELPPIHRVLIVLYHNEMLSYDEMAQTLDLPIGTVKSRLNRARLAMRNVLTSEPDRVYVA